MGHTRSPAHRLTHSYTHLPSYSFTLLGSRGEMDGRNVLLGAPSPGTSAGAKLSQWPCQHPWRGRELGRALSSLECQVLRVSWPGEQQKRHLPPIAPTPCSPGKEGEGRACGRGSCMARAWDERRKLVSSGLHKTQFLAGNFTPGLDQEALSPACPTCPRTQPS